MRSKINDEGELTYTVISVNPFFAVLGSMTRMERQSQKSTLD